MKLNKKALYEIIVSFLAIITISINMLDLMNKINLEKEPFLSLVDEFILYFFIVEYFVRLFISKEKKKFVKDNLLDLLAIIPFNSLFKFLRIAKLFRLAKLSKVLKFTRFIKLFSFIGKLKKKFDSFLRTNNLIYMLYVCISIILLGAIGIFILEKGITVQTFSDAIWWAFVTTTTVGYGDVSPITNAGRLIAGTLMIAGIGTIGMFTGTIATFFLKIEQEEEYNLFDEDLTEEEVKKVLEYIEFLKSKR